ncbi:hypothetical protein [Pontibacter populi]|uniref:Uncharacterized protein n=1 Tax=Pontibacter populi TaxID=890055 RepID=A0ABV1RXJ3_9BACT
MLNILAHYYAFAQVPNKGKTRFDEIYSTKDYRLLEDLRTKNKDLFLYLTDVPQAFRYNVRKEAFKCLIAKGNSISSIYKTAPESFVGFGDIKGTNDAFIIHFNKDWSKFELFVAPGQKNHTTPLLNAYMNGMFNEVIQLVRKKAAIM